MASPWRPTTTPARLVAEVLVDGKEAHLVRERQTLDDLIRGEHVPADKRETE
jgi:hypothetical protein